MRYPNIEAERLKRKMTNQALTAALGIKQDTLKRWQNGETEIRASKIVALAELFNVTTDYLLGRTVNPGQPIAQ